MGYPGGGHEMTPRPQRGSRVAGQPSSFVKVPST
jgi:hypothetical protein